MCRAVEFIVDVSGCLVRRHGLLNGIDGYGHSEHRRNYVRGVVDVDAAVVRRLDVHSAVFGNVDVQR